MSSKIRQTLYYLGTIIPGVIGIALIWGGIDSGVADNISQLVVGVLSLLGAGAPATAAVKVSQQRKDGTLDSSPVEAVVKNVNAIINAQAEATADLEKVKQAVTGAVGVIPGIGPLAQQVINSVHVPRL